MNKSSVAHSAGLIVWVDADPRAYARGYLLPHASHAGSEVARTGRRCARWMGVLALRRTLDVESWPEV